MAKSYKGRYYKKWESIKSNEETSKWIETSPSLIEYSDFIDMKIVIEHHWDSFKQIFGKRKEIIVGKIVELEQIRNKIAHNRKLTDSEFIKFKSYCDEILKCIEK